MLETVAIILVVIYKSTAVVVGLGTRLLLISYELAPLRPCRGPTAR